MYHIKFVSLLLETGRHTCCIRAVDGRADRHTDRHVTKPAVVVRNFTKIAKKKIVCCRP